MTSTGSLDILIAYIAPFIFLLAGFLITISAGGQVGSFVGGIATGAFAATAGRAKGWGKEKAKAGGEWALGGAERTAAGAAVGIGSGIEKFSDVQKNMQAQGFAEKLNKAVIMGGSLAGGVAMGAASPEGREKGVKWFARAKEDLGLEKRGTYEAGLRKDVGEEEKRLENVSIDELHKMARGSAETKSNNLQKSAAINMLTKKGEIDDGELNSLAANPEKAKTLGVKLRDVAKARPDYATRLIAPEPGKGPTTPTSIIEEMTPKKAGETIHSPSYINADVIAAVAASNTKILDGKMNKGNSKDIENIKTGFSNLLKDHLPNIVIDANNFEKTVKDPMNQSAIRAAIKTLKASPDKEDNIRGDGLRALANYARVGKLDKKP
jgi:hypothetical protein